MLPVETIRASTSAPLVPEAIIKARTGMAVSRLKASLKSLMTVRFRPIPTVYYSMFHGIDVIHSGTGHAFARIGNPLVASVVRARSAFLREAN